MAVTASTVNTTDTLETFRLQYNNLKSDVTSIDDTVSGGGSFVAADNITAGDDAVSIATTAGNITIDAQGSDTDILFKGTDSASDITALTLDMSDAGKAIFNGAISATTITLSADGGVIVPDDGNIGSASATTAMQISSAGIVTFVDDIIIKDAGTIGSASDTDAISISSGGVVAISATTTNTSTTSGALTVAGGVGIAENLTVGDKLRLKSDGAQLFFGASGELKFIHVADTGLILTHSGGTGDNLPIVFQLKSEEDAIIADEVIASLEFAAGDSDGTDGATVAAGIHAIAEDTFSASVNATKLVFTTGVSETAAASATAKMALSSAGKLAVSAQISGDAINVPITLDSTDGSANAGDNIVQEAGSDENDRMLYEDALFDSIETVKSHGVTFPGQRIQVSGGASADIVTLTDGTLIESDFGSGTNFSVTLADNRTLQNPTGLVAGQSGSIFVTQDGTGSRTLAFGSFFHFAGGTAPTMTTTASAIDRIDYIVKSTSVIHAVVSLDVKATS